MGTEQVLAIGVEGKQSNISADLEKEFWDIHQGLFGIMGVMRMVKAYAETETHESQAAADIVEVFDQYVPVVDKLRVRLDAAICELMREVRS